MIELKLKNRKGSFHVNSKEVKDIITEQSQETALWMAKEILWVPVPLQISFGTICKRIRM